MVSSGSTIPAGMPAGEATVGRGEGESLTVAGTFPSSRGRRFRPGRRGVRRPGRSPPPPKEENRQARDDDEDDRAKDEDP